MRELRNQSVAGRNGRPVLYDAFLPEGDSPAPVVIFSHGFKGFKDWGPFNLVAQTFAASGVAFVKFNFAFNGTTADQPADFADLNAFADNNFSKEAGDLELMTDFVSDRIKSWNLDAGRLALLGHSRGGGISIVRAVEDPRVAGLITWASISGIGKFLSSADTASWKREGVIFVENMRTGQQMPLGYQLYEDYLNHRDRFDIAGRLGSLNRPYLIVHGTHDDTVPHADALLLAAACPQARLLTIAGGDHSFGGSHPFTGTELPGHLARVTDETIKFVRQL